MVFYQVKFKCGPVSHESSPGMQPVSMYWSQIRFLPQMLPRGSSVDLSNRTVVPNPQATDRYKVLGSNGTGPPKDYFHFYKLLFNLTVFLEIL
ncbi:hypothetical protein AVEN_53401-1 [Araneus ventricosus]|uniref:Uncharacterized protein n=1 Tax=Araneus ventricosus TaxID=182803 RepID=A0A4Y2ACN1_ARAVE|nr:hypothetical protein AVEN_53401-1 [Araneus ventricosus]